MMSKLYEFDIGAFDNTYPIVGIDEVGRGCIAGPVYVAGVMLDLHTYHSFYEEINDSKLIDEANRKILCNLILTNTLYNNVIILNRSSVEIDKIGITACIRNMMHECINYFEREYEYINVISDRILPPLNTNNPYLNLIDGDSLSLSVAAASIVAKHFRDLYMVRMSNVYPEYSFSSNKGYCTKSHMDALKLYGIIPGFHRISYEPIKSAIENLITYKRNSGATL